MLAVILFLLLLILVPLIFYLSSRNNSKKIKANGERIRAKIVKIEKEPLYRYNTKSSSYNTIVYRIIAKAEIDGEIKEFESERIYPENLSKNIGDRIFIYIDRKKTSSYFVDIVQ